MPARTRSLLVELFVEELPPKALRALGEAFAAGLLRGLAGQGLTGDDTAATAFASPRRLAAHLTGIAAQAADRPQSQKLMPVKVALDADGQPSTALLKKLASLGLDASAAATLARRSDGKVESLYLDSVASGAALVDGLQAALDRTLADLPIPKLMTYQLADGWTSVQFVRPAHGLVALHGDEVVPVTALAFPPAATPTATVSRRPSTRWCFGMPTAMPSRWRPRARCCPASTPGGRRSNSSFRRPPPRRG